MRLNSFFLLAFLLLSNCKSISQNSSDLKFEVLEKQLLQFMINNNDFSENEVEDYTSGKFHLRIAGVQKSYSSGKVMDGIYSFGRLTTHTRSYFLIVEDNKFTILNISSRQGLDRAIIDVLDFCDRKKYCVKLTTDYISRIIHVYYTKNVNPAAGMDTNCEYGVKDVKEVP